MKTFCFHVVYPMDLFLYHVITILNLHAGLILLQLWPAFIGVIVGGQIGPYVSRFIPNKLLKIIFALSVIIIAVFYVYKGISYIMENN